MATGSKEGRSRSTPLEDVRSAEAVGGERKPSPGGESPKPHGDKMGTGAAATVTASEAGEPGDSPKRQGDPLRDTLPRATSR